MPKRLAYTLFILMASSRNFCITSGLRTAGQSHWPVIETPSRASLAQFLCHFLERYGKLVSDAWYVPRIVATFNLRRRVASVSSARATISYKLQNCLDCKIISPHGLPPQRGIVSEVKWARRRLGKVNCRPPRLYIPRSPEPDFISAIHSSINSVLVGLFS